MQGSSVDLQPDSQFRYISHGMATTLSHMDAILCTICGFTLGNAQSTPISPVPGILRTNCFPTDNETVQIRRAVEEVESEVAQLEWETSRVQDILKKLESKHQELKRFQSDHLALLTPARRLIPEILSEIFIQCLPSFDSLCKRRSQTPINTPLCLGQICSGWRAVVFSTHQSSGPPSSWTISRVGPRAIHCHWQLICTIMNGKSMPSLVSQIDGVMSFSACLCAMPVDLPMSSPTFPSYKICTWNYAMCTHPIPLWTYLRMLRVFAV